MTDKKNIYTSTTLKTKFMSLKNKPSFGIISLIITGEGKSFAVWMR